ncbi:uncharacterized protein LOC143909926 isoform X2 [Arctopsyche grandis]|uniref:uncharacterized protein LOC143909926 isoform X2 n=1 Tax=Arctopsyche grandis TaxID=121162 RepID=UPI00406D9F95
MNISENVLENCNICRLCLKNGELQSIFNAEDNFIQYSDKLMSLCITIKISPCDNFPRFICNECIHTLNLSYVFKKQCEESDFKLRSSNLSDLSTDEKFSAKVNDTENVRDIIENQLQSVQCENWTKVKNGFRSKSVKCDLKSVISTEIDDIEDEHNESGDGDDHITDSSQLPNNKNEIPPSNIDSTKIPKLQIVDKKNYNCDICGRRFTIRPNLERHISLHSGGRGLCCHICGQRFSLAGALKTHMRVHTGEKPYKCSECDAKFSQPGSLVTHKRRHSGEQPFVCDTCGKAFTSHGGLARHKRTHTGERRAQCTVCGKKFVSVSYLPEHMRLHTGEKPFKCKVCGKEFALAGNLSVHSRSHAINGVHSCNQCGRSYTDLRAHLRTHSDERPYKCSHCLKTFKQHSNLKYHLTTHTGERKFVCLVCNKKFKTNEILKEHTNIHTGDRPYKCDKCEKSFRSTSSRRKHSKKCDSIASSNEMKSVCDSGKKCGKVRKSEITII